MVAKNVDKFPEIVYQDDFSFLAYITQQMMVYTGKGNKNSAIESLSFLLM